MICKYTYMNLGMLSVLVHMVKYEQKLQARCVIVSRSLTSLQLGQQKGCTVLYSFKPF